MRYTGHPDKERERETDSGQGQELRLGRDEVRRGQTVAYCLTTTGYGDLLTDW